MSLRKLLASVAVLTALCGTLTSCSSGTSANASAGKLNFANDKSWNFKDLSNLSNKDIHVKLESQSYLPETAYTAFVKQSLRTSEAPGMFTWHTGEQLKQLVDQNLVMDTSSIWAKAIANGDVSPTLRDLYTVNGKQYCTPIGVDDWVMYYDKATFAKYHLTPPKTWNDMMKDATVLKSHGVSPFWSSGGTWSFVWFQVLLAGTDLQLYQDLATGKASYTDPRVVAVMNQWLQMEKAGYFSDPGSKTAPATQMKDGHVAMIPYGTWFASTLEQVGLKNGTDWGVFTIPTVKAQAGANPVAIETSATCATKHSTQRDLGLKYSQWWMGADAQTAWSKLQGNLPFNPKAQASTPTFQDLGKELSVPKKYEFYVRYYDTTPTPILTTALNQFTGFMTNPGNPAPYLQGIQSAASTYWAGNK
ncbi:extracellular solute-binding protein [Streptomyces sp. NPDC047009]|uniref:ABC transporter substrate-binding protein n=1 Tax=Streptomyces sp. NPDC047009 TaxID=3154496 RepID=UPI00340FE7B8